MQSQRIGLHRVEPGALRLPAFEPFDDGVSQIVERVRAGGDAALAAIARELGDPPPRRITTGEMARAFARISADVRDALEGAARRIEAFAVLQRDALHEVSTRIETLEIGQRVLPMGRAGIYVPGGTHPLPSSLLMGVIPARVAGVEGVAVCTPKAAPATLAAAHVASVDEMYEMGGAQSIAAFAYGTASIPPVDVIAGPGNAYVTAAKRLVLGVCGIDVLAGPSEVLVIASGDADARLAALDLLAQAEHDARASAILLTDDESFADAVDDEISTELQLIATSDIARASLEKNGRCSVLALADAAGTCNRLAPEHVCLHGKRAEALEPALRSYGALFIGSHTAEVFGDYGSGPNHVLPTSGSARFTSGLSVYTFLTIRTYQRAAQRTPHAIVEQTAVLAREEGLDAHRRAALARSP
jgi:histidinol dehydrogenase